MYLKVKVEKLSLNLTLTTTNRYLINIIVCCNMKCFFRELVILKHGIVTVIKGKFKTELFTDFDELNLVEHANDERF